MPTYLPFVCMLLLMLRTILEYALQQALQLNFIHTFAPHQAYIWKYISIVRRINVYSTECMHYRLELSVAVVHFCTTFKQWINKIFSFFTTFSVIVWESTRSDVELIATPYTFVLLLIIYRDCWVLTHMKISVCCSLIP